MYSCPSSCCRPSVTAQSLVKACLHATNSTPIVMHALTPECHCQVVDQGLPA